jgi:hypothetical protein
MGIYIIKSIHSDWIKKCHHKITEKRPSVYYRYINSGFYSVVCPNEIKDKVSFDDLELIHWFHNLDLPHEKLLHKQLKQLYQHVGEWYKYDKLDDIVNIICNEYNGVLHPPTINEYNDAKTWCNDFRKKRETNRSTI